MTPRMTRRQWLEMLAASTALAGCENVVVNVQNKGGTNEDGIEPISSNERFYVYQCCAQPEVDPLTWSLSVQVEGTEVARITPQTFDELVPVELEHTLQCIGGNPRNPLINNAVWGGLPFLEVLEHLGVAVPEDAVDLRFLGADDYDTGVPVEDLLASKLWLVWRMNGEPMPYDHGAPCRFLAQGRYGTKNVKWPIEVDFVPYDFRGFWENSGWSDDATYRQNGFILQPVDGTIVNGDTVAIYGTSYAGEDPVTSVEISFDEGESWEPVEVYYSPGANIWTLWKHEITGVSGDVTAEIRVTTASGKVTQGTEGTGQSRGYDGGMRIRFEVRP
ncbi:MAG: molybdopterin-dependent oxidoreductase [Myxococcota bacterium]